MDIPVETFRNHLIGSRLCKFLYNNEQKNTMVCVKRNKKDAFVIINGTNKVCHWLHNLSIKLTSEGKHSGFESFSRKCYNEIVEQFNDCIENDSQCFEKIQNVYIVSHSLGASALIIMLYDQLVKLYPEYSNMLDGVNIDIVMLGAPKSGNKQFVESFKNIINRHGKNIKLFRYNIQNDIVSLYPPIPEYTHVCDAIELYDQKDLLRVLYNHSLHNYISNFKRILSYAYKNDSDTITILKHISTKNGQF